jgi:hypothetical protein
VLRYLSAAFWARPRIWGLGRVPWNALAVFGAAIFGFAEHAVWLGGLGLETLYLFSIGTNPRFQRWVDAQDVAAVAGETEEGRAQLVQSLGGAARQRLVRLEEKVTRIEKMYQQSRGDDYLYDTNRDAIKKLTWAFLKLLVAQRNLLMLGNQSNEMELQQKIAALEGELKGATTDTLRESKKATIDILRQRVNNGRRRAETLAEVDSDLGRVEAQIDLALEQASMKDKPTAISANIQLVSRMLDDDYGDASSTIASLDQKYETEQR